MVTSSNSRRLRLREAVLKSRIEDRLVNYALCAGAAGVAMLAAAPVEAQIVYTPANIHFEREVDLDINNDGVTDFAIAQNTFSFSTGVFTRFLHVDGAPGNGLRGYDSGFFASRLAKGAKIGASRAFYRNKGLFMASDNSYLSSGPWKHDASGFLGLEFQIDGQAHYGWAEVSITGKQPYRGVVKGYAYNTVPNQPIHAGQTSDHESITEAPTLGALALGAPGLSLWRRQPTR